MIIYWTGKDERIYPVVNMDNSIKSFKTLEKADEFANLHEGSVSMRVISIEGVKCQ